MRTYQVGQFLRQLENNGCGINAARGSVPHYFRITKVGPVMLTLIDEEGKTRNRPRLVADERMTIVPSSEQIPLSLRMHPQTPPANKGDRVTVLTQVVSVGGTPTLKVNPVTSIEPGKWVRITIEVIEP